MPEDAAVALLAAAQRRRQWHLCSTPPSQPTRTKCSSLVKSRHQVVTDWIEEFVEDIELASSGGGGAAAHQTTPRAAAASRRASSAGAFRWQAAVLVAFI